MRLIKNKLIPFKGFALINLFGFVFYKKESDINIRTLNHEAIHTAQMKELFYIFFYIWYLIEWVIGLFANNFRNGKAYASVCFEKEAYAKDTNLQYLDSRPKYAFLKYMKK